ncbi:MAG: putative histidine biosynthesis bifunctional protein hisie (Bifunctional phosphoribosyl-amp cyclohydrolase/phosphoribosyl-atp pyrophosphatase protein), partial [uncultured bacterium]
MKLNTVELAWGKMNGLLPAIIQDAKTKTILMVGYMNQNALQKTMETKWVTFYSRSKNKLWVKGETSGNKLEFIDIFSDCDHDALLIFANPTGPICHQGTQSCFGKTSLNDWEFILNLEKIILDRQKIRSEKSYTSSLFDAGISRIAQKVGEEGIEVVLAAIEKNDAEFCGEIADLLFHVLVLLRARN